MEFKKLEIKQEGSFLKRLMKSPGVWRTVIFAIAGGAGGFLFFYFTDGVNMVTIPAVEIFKSIALGAFWGIFITNSPCARGRC